MASLGWNFTPPTGQNRWCISYQMAKKSQNWASNAVLNKDFNKHANFYKVNRTLNTLYANNESIAK